jgi:nucleotide-binding universal stress UspA family protein
MRPVPTEPGMNSPEVAVPDRQLTDRKPIQRLLFVSDAAVADVGELPSSVRAVIDDAAELYVVTPSLSGRLAWLATELNPSRHAADERLHTVLDHMHSIGARARGTIGDDTIMTALEDAVADFHPDHILIALHSSQHANWHERGLIKRVEHRFGLPVTTFAVGPGGHVQTADGPLLICYDGSRDAKHAIEQAGRLLGGKHALVVTVWEPAARRGAFGMWGAPATMADFVELDRAAAERSLRVANQGVGIAQNEGLRAEPLAVEATGPVWKAILDIADHRDAAMIVTGSRGLAGVRSMLLGSVSSAVVNHSERPTLIIGRPAARAQHRPDTLPAAA